jgi:hypothetical protein
MIRAQIRSGRLCGRHWEVLEGLRRRGGSKKK